MQPTMSHLAISHRQISRYGIKPPSPRRQGASFPLPATAMLPTSDSGNGSWQQIDQLVSSPDVGTPVGVSHVAPAGLVGLSVPPVAAEAEQEVGLGWAKGLLAR